jgi:hypothetical protein
MLGWNRIGGFEISNNPNCLEFYHPKLNSSLFAKLEKVSLAAYQNYN